MFVQSKQVLAVGGCYLSVIYIFLNRVVINSDRLFHSDSGCSPKLIDIILCIFKRIKQIILNVESEVKVCNVCTVKTGSCFKGWYLTVINIFLDRKVIDSEKLLYSDSGCSPKLIYHFNILISIKSRGNCLIFQNDF